MNEREMLESAKQKAEELFAKEKDITAAKLEDLLGRVKKADPRWVNAFYGRLRNETLDALENLGRSAALIDTIDIVVKELPKPQNRLAFADPADIWNQ